MTPPCSVNYCSYFPTRHSVHFGELGMAVFTRAIMISYLNHFGFSKLNSPCSFPEHMPSFAYRIFHIVGMSSKKQVIWVTAKRIVTFVTHLNIFGNCPERKYVCESAANSWLTVNGELSIVMDRCGRFPVPTFKFLFLIDFRPKAFLDIFYIRRVSLPCFVCGNAGKNKISQRGFPAASVCLHKLVCLVCATSQATTMALRHFYCVLTRTKLQGFYA